MDFTNAFELFKEAFETMLGENYYFSLFVSISVIGMVIVYIVKRLTNRD